MDHTLMEIIEIISEQILEFDGGETVLVLDADEVEILDVAEQGAPGIQGQVGPAGAVTQTLVAGEALGGHRFVVSNASGHAIYADQSVAAHANKVLGMTLGAAALGTDVQVQQSGEHTEPSWAWTLDAPIWLAAAGLMTQTVPTTGFSLIVGFPITATKILINLREPLILN